MVSDPIADILIRIKNAGMIKSPSTTVPHSKLKLAIANLLLRKGYLTAVDEKGKGVKRAIEMSLAFSVKGKPKVTDVARISRLSRRIYLGVKEIKPVRQGYGILVLSTPKGIMTGEEAKREHVGGEALFKIW